MPTPRAQMPREFDDQDRILRRQRDQQHEADLRVEIVGGAEQRERAGRAEQRERHREHHGQRQQPAFVSLFDELIATKT
jgi:hypothetical protein